MITIMARRSMGTTNASLPWSWIARLREFLGLSSEEAPRIVLEKQQHSPRTTTSAPQTISQASSMHTSSLQAVAARIPLIKFVGARLPRPNFNRDALPIIPNPSPKVAFSSPPKATSIGSVGTIPRGSGIDESRMPLKFRRPLISQEECEAINVGWWFIWIVKIDFVIAYILDRILPSFVVALLFNDMKLFKNTSLCEWLFGMHVEQINFSPSSSKDVDVLSYVQQIIACIIAERLAEQQILVDKVNSILTIRPDLSGVTKFYVPLSKSKNSNEPTKQFLKALEICDDDITIIMLCRIAHGFLAEDNFKGKLARMINLTTKGSNKSVRRHKRLVKADACSHCIRSLRFRLQASSAARVAISCSAATANDALASVLLSFGTKDPRLTLKMRLGGIMPSLCAMVYSSKENLPSSAMLKLLCRAVRSPRNAQLCGRQPDFAASIVSRMTMFSQSTDLSHLMLLPKYLELLYFINKNRKTRIQLIQDGVVSRVLALVVRHLDLRRKAGSTTFVDKGISYSLAAIHTELCLVAIAILRALANNKKAKLELVSLGAIAMCERTIGMLAAEEEQRTANVDKQLQDSLCALCLRCLPALPFPLSGVTFPVRFAIPRATTPTRSRSLSKSPMKPVGAGSPNRNRRSSEKVKSFDDAMSSDDDCVDEEDAVFSLDDSEVMRSDDDEREIVDKSRKETAPTYSRLRTSELSQYDDFFIEYKDGAISNGPSRPWTTYNDAIQQQSVATCSVMPFTSLAYPDYVDSDVDRTRQPLAPSDDSMKEMVVQHMARNRITSSFQSKVVFDLDKLCSSEDGAKTHGHEPMTFEDRNMVGKIDSSIDHLIFDSRFESGNLRRATQISQNHYELVLSPDVNQLKDHYQWFYFRVSNIQPNVQYTFEIVNCLKTTSMYSKGMQPVMYSVREAMSGRGGWFRGGQGVCYYRNLYAVSTEEEDSNQTASTSAADSEKGKKKHYFYSIRFNMNFANKGDVFYMAYHYPYTYSYLNVTIERLLNGMTNSVYCRRDVITKSLGGNPIIMLTITAPGSSSDVAQRETILISARVHPGESNASWMMHGILESLLCNSEQFTELLTQFVVKVIPMLNPDGVVNGSHRCSLAGIDLNRVWDKPNRAIHPEIHHSKGIFQYLVEVRNRSPWMFVDLHGHSRRSNIFVFGNNPEESYLTSDKDQLSADGEYMVLPEILDKCSPSFSLKNSRFDISRAKEASARQAIWRQFGISRAYTMEATYCGFETGAYKGFQIGTRELKDMGTDLLHGIVEAYRRHLTLPVLPSSTATSSSNRTTKQSPKRISVVGRKSRVSVSNSPNTSPSGTAAATVVTPPEIIGIKAQFGGREVGE